MHLKGTLRKSYIPTRDLILTSTENSSEEYNSYVSSSFKIQTDVLQELAARQSQNDPVEMLCGACGSQVEYESDYVAFEKDTGVTLECMKKCICFQVHQRLLSEKKNKLFSLSSLEKNKVGQEREGG